jgi:hypothetical protein
MSRYAEKVPYTYCFCRRCAARVELGRIAFGTNVTCHACGLEFTIEHQAHSRDGAGQGGGGETLDEEGIQTAWEAGDRSLVRLLFSGTFTFPLRLENLPRTLTLSIGAVALVGAYRLGAWCYTADSETIGRSTRVLLANGLLLSVVFASLALPAWFYAMSSCGMTIFRETSCGVDRIRDWPNLLALDDLGDVFYAINSVLLTAAPARLAAPLWRRLDVPIPWAVGIVVIVLLPVVLLSMLVAESPVHPLSWPICKSLVRRWSVWLAFYLTTAILVAGVVAIEQALHRHAGWPTQIIASGVLLVLTAMIYSRLLGRLASACVSHPLVGASRANLPGSL